MILEFKLEDQPSEFYFRRALKTTSDPNRLRGIASDLVDELEELHAWAKKRGLAAPRGRVMPDDPLAKTDAAICPIWKVECRRCQSCAVQSERATGSEPLPFAS